jgi:hypothetical protein
VGQIRGYILDRAVDERKRIVAHSQPELSVHLCSHGQRSNRDDALSLIDNAHRLAQVIQHYLQRHFLVKIYVSGAIEGEWR